MSNSYFERYVTDVTKYFMYPQPNAEPDTFNLLTEQPILDQVFTQSSEHMTQIRDRTVSLIVTSPPYNVDKDYGTYNDNKTLQEYLAYLFPIWQECYRVLRIGGKLCINISGIKRKPYHPLTDFVIHQCLQIGFFMRGIVIWDKGASSLTSYWGSFASPSNPVIRDCHEFLLIFGKESGQLKRAVSSLDPDITNEEFTFFTQSIWRINPSLRKDHPAPFPDELAFRCIKLFTYPQDLVVDPFAGSGTTLYVAKALNRHYLGYEIDPHYSNLITRSLRQSYTIPTYNYLTVTFDISQLSTLIRTLSNGTLSVTEGLDRLLQRELIAPKKARQLRNRLSHTKRRDLLFYAQKSADQN